MAELKAGMQVLYVPHHDHHLGTDHKGDPIWEFVHEKDCNVGHPASPRPVRKGDVANDHLSMIGSIEKRNKDGHLECAGGAVLRPSRPLHYWPATILEVLPDGSAALEIKHPNGRETHYVPDRKLFPDAAGLKHDPAKSLHTFHLQGE